MKTFFCRNDATTITANTATTGGDLLDSIIESQRQTLAPAVYMRVCRDDTLEPRQSMDRYCARLEQKIIGKTANSSSATISATIDDTSKPMSDDDMDLEVSTADTIVDEVVPPSIVVPIVESNKPSGGTTQTVRKLRWQPMDDTSTIARITSQQPSSQRHKIPLLPTAAAVVPNQPMMMLDRSRPMLFSRPPPQPASSSHFNPITTPPPLSSQPHSGLLPTPQSTGFLHQQFDRDTNLFFINNEHHCHRHSHNSFVNECHNSNHHRLNNNNSSHHLSAIFLVSIHRCNTFTTTISTFAAKIY